MNDDVVDVSNNVFWSKKLLKILKNKITSNCKRLDLSNNVIDIEIAKYLSEIFIKNFCEILSLNLSHTLLTIETSNIIFSSFKNQKIVELYLDDLILKEESINVLMESLNTCKQIQVLSLSGCDLDYKCCQIIGNSIPHSLTHLILESNSMQEYGLASFTNNIKKSNVISFEISDNMIWSQEMSKFLSSITPTSSYNGLHILDIAYNCVNLSDLSSFLSSAFNLKELSISGCKVEKNKIVNFFTSLSSSSLEVLHIDSLDLEELPVIWNQVSNSIFFNTDYLNSFIEFIQESRTIKKVFISDIPLYGLHRIGTFNKNIQLGINKFCESNDIVIVDYPMFKLSFPTDELVINRQIQDKESEFFDNVFRNSFHKKEFIKKIKFNFVYSTDEMIVDVISGIPFATIDSLKMSVSKYTDKILVSLKTLAMKSVINGLHFLKGNFDESTAIQVFQLFIDSHVTLSELTIGISATGDERSSHKYTNILCDFIETNDKLKSLVLRGSVSPFDSAKILESCHKTNTVEFLIIESSYLKNYMGGPEKCYQTKLDECYIVEIEALHKVVSSKKRSLRVFEDKLLTEVYIQSPNLSKPLNDALMILEKRTKY